MKKSLLFLVLICIVCANPLYAQGGLLKKVAGAMKDELLGTGGSSSKQEPEPGCACDQPEVVLDMNGKFKLDYKEMNITTTDDGSLLAQDRRTGEFYIVKGGATQGPYKEGDPRIAGYSDVSADNQGMDGLLIRYKGIISKSGEKYQITFGGKTYGPYAEIHDFTLSKSKDKFACLVIEEILATEDEGKKMEQAINNAKSDQERMELAMKYSQQMANKVMQAGGAQNTMPKFVTNVEDASYDPMRTQGSFTGNAKYDDILVVTYNAIQTLQGKTLFNLTNEMMGASSLFVNSSNSKYAYFNYGTLTFSDNKTLTDCFNPHLEKISGQGYLVYMYYSPKRNAIVQCKIPW
jgi:hypothetical protein